MPNRFYANIIDLLTGSKARATEVEANFTLVEAGFDALAVEYDATQSGLSAQVALKANKAGDTYTGAHNFTGATLTAATLAPGTATLEVANAAFVALKASLLSPALTGVPTAPTAATGNNSNQLATTAFVASTGLSSALPGQTGNAGAYITTDGVSASWQMPAPLAVFNQINYGGF